MAPKSNAIDSGNNKLCEKVCPKNEFFSQIANDPKIPKDIAKDGITNKYKDKIFIIYSIIQ